MARSPRAPVPRERAWSAMATRASSVTSSSMSSNSNRRWYCFTRAFRGSTRILTSASASSWETEPTTGRRPTNSGIRPNLMRSSGRTSANSAPRSFSPGDRTSAPKPTPVPPWRLSISCSRPANAPPQMNKMFVVSIWRNSWWGCLRPPWGGTAADVPSRIFSRACCTPSPETSRVMDGFSLLRATLSISSM